MIILTWKYIFFCYLKQYETAKPKIDYNEGSENTNSFFSFFYSSTKSKNLLEIGLIRKLDYRSQKRNKCRIKKKLDVLTLTNGHDIFQCNLCSFESGDEDRIKEHLIDHLNHTNNINFEEGEETENKILQ